MNTVFQCDVCNEIIRDPSEGVLQWLTRDDEKGKSTCHGLRIVHAHSPTNGRCLYDERREYLSDGSIVGDASLKEYTNLDGLTYLLEMIYRGEHPIEDVIRIIQRIFTDHYESAHKHAQYAIEIGLLEENITPGFYHIKTLQAALELHRNGRLD